MTTEVLYLMAEDSSPPFNGKQVLKLTSEDHQEETDDSKQKTLVLHPVALKELAKNKAKEKPLYKHTVYKPDPPVLGDSESVPANPVNPLAPYENPFNGQRAPPINPVVQYARRGLGAFVEFVILIFFRLLDFLVSCGVDEHVRNVIFVIFTVALEVFVTIILAVSAVFASVIINIDDAYQRNHTLRFEHDGAPERDQMTIEEAKSQLPAPKPRPLRVHNEQQVTCTPTSIKSAVQQLVDDVNSNYGLKESESVIGTARTAGELIPIKRKRTNDLSPKIADSPERGAHSNNDVAQEPNSSTLEQRKTKKGPVRTESRPNITRRHDSFTYSEDSCYVSSPTSTSQSSASVSDSVNHSVASSQESFKSYTVLTQQLSNLQK